MVVEQFRKDGGEPAADDGDAGGDAGRVPGLYERREHRGLGAARDRRRRDRGRIRRGVRSGVRAGRIRRRSTRPRSTSRRWKSRSRRWKSRWPSRTRWSCRSRRPPPASSQLSDVDSYVAGAESTYASSARVATGQPRFTPPAIEEEDPRSPPPKWRCVRWRTNRRRRKPRRSKRPQEAAAQEAAAQEAAAAASAAASTPESAAAAAAAPAASNEPNAWDCPICLSGAPQSALAVSELRLGRESAGSGFATRNGTGRSASRAAGRGAR